jgi:hypothetical protein
VRERMGICIWALHCVVFGFCGGSDLARSKSGVFERFNGKELLMNHERLELLDRTTRYAPTNI